MIDLWSLGNAISNGVLQRASDQNHTNLAGAGTRETIIYLGEDSTNYTMRETIPDWADSSLIT